MAQSRSNPSLAIPQLSVLTPGSDHPLLSWMRPARWLQAEYQITEIRLDGEETRVRTLRKTLRDGVVTEERLDARLGPEAYNDALEQMQRQSQAMLETMLLPWLGWMSAALPAAPDVKEGWDKR